MKKIIPYIIAILIPLAVGGLSAFLTSGNMDLTINQPPLSPPPQLFPIVWTALYILMGIGSAIIYTNRSENPEAAADALKTYALQLIVNFFWSIIFFNMHAYLFAFVWLVILWLLIVSLIRQFHKISPAAAYLQIPYLLWVTFAGYLTLMIFLLNR